MARYGSEYGGYGGRNAPRERGYDLPYGRGFAGGRGGRGPTGFGAGERAGGGERFGRGAAGPGNRGHDYGGYGGTGRGGGRYGGDYRQPERPRRYLGGGWGRDWNWGGSNRYDVGW